MSASAKDQNKKYILISKENERIEVPHIVIKESHVLTQMTAITAKKNEPIPLPTISSSTLKKIKAFCEKFENAPDYLIPIGHVPEQSVSPWIEHLKDCEGDSLVDLLQAANFLNIPRLIDAGLLKIKSFIDGQNIENIRGILNLPADLSHEEEQEIAEKHIWSIIDPRDDNDSSLG